MPRILTTITEDMQSALRRVSQKTGIPVAKMVRLAIIQYLEANGEKIEDADVKWGGDRHQSATEDEEESQAA